MKTISASEARRNADAARLAVTRAHLEMVYAQIDKAAKLGRYHAQYIAYLNADETIYVLGHLLSSGFDAKSSRYGVDTTIEVRWDKDV